MAPSATDLNALVQGTDLEIETLKQMKNGSVALFDGLIAEAHKRKVTLSQQEVAAKARLAPNRVTGISARSYQQILSIVRRDIDAYKQDINVSNNRYRVARDEADATRKNNIAKTKLVARAATALEKTGRLVFELRDAFAAIKPDGGNELLARVNVAIGEIQGEIEQLNKDYQALHAGQDEHKIMIEAQDRAIKKCAADTASLEKRLKGMRGVEALLVGQMRT